MVYPLLEQHDALPEQVEQALGLHDSIVVLDVRTDPEYIARHIPGAMPIPIDTLPGALEDIDPEVHYVVVCEHGVRSRAASEYLRSQGFRHITNMVGGMSRWTGPTERGRPGR